MDRNFQTEFEQKYITPLEIELEVGVTRVAVFHARKRGQLPGEISVSDGRVIIWDRQHIAPYIADWKNKIQAGK